VGVTGEPAKKNFENREEKNWEGLGKHGMKEVNRPLAKRGSVEGGRRSKHLGSYTTNLIVAENILWEGINVKGENRQEEIEIIILGWKKQDNEQTL